MMTEALKRAQAKYNKEHTRAICLRLNTTVDIDIIDHLNRKDNVQGYIKEIIRKDMKEEKRMRYILIDNALSTASEIFDEELRARTPEEAITEAKHSWEYLTKKEQETRDAFYVIELTDEEYREMKADENGWGNWGKVIWEAK